MDVFNRDLIENLGSCVKQRATQLGKLDTPRDIIYKNQILKTQLKN